MDAVNGLKFEKEKNTKREEWVDAVKGWAIYLVVLGHCIQYATPEHYEYSSNIFFRLIYGFHMPLFMVMSGYLFWNSLQKYTLKEGIISKLKGIMIPCAVWGLITYLCDIFIFHYNIVSLYEYFDYTFYSNWFLWAVFYCSILGFVAKYVFKNYIAGYVVLVVINYFIPDILNFAGAKRLFIFFVLGIFIKRYNLMQRMNAKIQIIFIGVLMIAYPITLKFQCVEVITGTVGSFLVIFILYNLCKCYDMKILQELGKVSISIYLMSGILFYFWIKESMRIDEAYRYRVKFAYIMVMSLVLTLLTYAVSKLLEKNKLTSKLFLGR